MHASSVAATQGSVADKPRGLTTQGLPNGVADLRQAQGMGTVIAAPVSVAKSVMVAANSTWVRGGAG